uniref:SET and MYND domain containing 1 n=1 Tax=Cricetulus griseus TaxID=10029 RepID=A0A8C2LQ88_CRIGR
MTIGSMENVEVFTSEGKGRGLKATKEFWAADVVFAERAYSAVVFDRYGMLASPMLPLPT